MEPGRADHVALPERRVATTADDALLAMFVTGAVVCLERALANRSKKRAGFLAGAALLMGFATLTKSFIGLLLPGLTVALYLLMRCRLRELFRVGLIATFLAGLAIAAVWYGAALVQGGTQFFQWQIRNGLWGRFLGTEKGLCQHPFYYFVPRLVSGFLPWSLYLPALCAALWFDRRALSDQVIFAACWFMAIFGFFSASAGKCVVYILPAFPPIAALTGWLFYSRIAGRLERVDVRGLFDVASALVGITVALAVVATLVLAIGGAPTWLLARMHHTDRCFLAILVGMARTANPKFVLWASASVVAAMVIEVTVRRHPTPACVAIGMVALTGTFFWCGAMNPALAREQTLKPFARVVDSAVPANDRVYYVGQPDCDLAFYAHHGIGSVKRFGCQLGSGDNAQYFVFRQDGFASMPERKRGCIKVLAESRPVDGHGRRLLVERIAAP